MQGFVAYDFGERGPYVSLTAAQMIPLMLDQAHPAWYADIIQVLTALQELTPGLVCVVLGGLQNDLSHEAMVEQFKPMYDGGQNSSIVT